MEIAKGITSDHFNNLALDNYGSNDWSIGFSFLDKRLTERYIEPADILISAEKTKTAINKKYGFTILAIDCLLIETIQSFYEGVLDSTGKSKTLFKNFLLTRENFKPFFKTNDQAVNFYIQFRCGILHQGQTFGNTKVWSVGPLINRTGNSVIVNRNLFHEAIKKEKGIYLNILTKKEDHLLMNNFKKKMKYIASL